MTVGEGLGRAQTLPVTAHKSTSSKIHTYRYGHSFVTVMVTLSCNHIFVICHFENHTFLWSHLAHSVKLFKVLVVFELQAASIQQHAIEARIYAEDPSRNFAPSPGLLKVGENSKGALEPHTSLSHSHTCIATFSLSHLHCHCLTLTPALATVSRERVHSSRSFECVRLRLSSMTPGTSE